ncbi:hypothetical protein D5018_13775 [Parashewanella curva]|uniref:Uncharacterized protein n=1 Tax=Parashewanella curva TaxID=2338552 RepID=A0A3L8PXF3_9GAMM|nr:hypothetical protein [Parashewanella curva]RLV59138.1 hypothetical protein D5018_13775 [Parashewanella curva]
MGSPVVASPVGQPDFLLNLSSSPSSVTAEESSDWLVLDKWMLKSCRSESLRGVATSFHDGNHFTPPKEDELSSLVHFANNLPRYRSRTNAFGIADAAEHLTTISQLRSPERIELLKSMESLLDKVSSFNALLPPEEMGFEVVPRNFAGQAHIILDLTEVSTTKASFVISQEPIGGKEDRKIEDSSQVPKREKARARCYTWQAIISTLMNRKSTYGEGLEKCVTVNKTLTAHGHDLVRREMSSEVTEPSQDSSRGIGIEENIEKLLLAMKWLKRVSVGVKLTILCSDNITELLVKANDEKINAECDCFFINCNASNAERSLKKEFKGEIPAVSESEKKELSKLCLLKKIMQLSDSVFVDDSILGSLQV